MVCQCQSLAPRDNLKLRVVDYIGKDSRCERMFLGMLSQQIQVLSFSLRRLVVISGPIQDEALSSEPHGRRCHFRWALD